MKVCVLKGFGACRGKLSAEHFISEALLKQMAPGKSRVRVGGFPWQPAETYRDVGMRALTSKVLCVGHNNGLSRFDTAASNLFYAIDTADKSPERARPETAVSGPDVERWLLKALFGHEAAKDPAAVPSTWKHILAGRAWPENWGLYLGTPAEGRVLAREVSFETFVHPESRAVLAANFSFGGVLFWLVLGDFRDRSGFGNYRPSGIIFEIEERTIRIAFNWPFATQTAVVYRRTGLCGEPPPSRAWFSKGPG